MSSSYLSTVTPGILNARTRTMPKSICYPLSEFYEQLRLPLPRIQQLRPEDVPEPYRRLLVHENDMTPTLQAEYGRSLCLRVLRYQTTDQIMDRLVVLRFADEPKTVSVGAIRIFLDPLPGEAKQFVLERRLPFGAILQKLEIRHYSRPVAFFQVTPDTMLSDALEINGARVLYGRQNTIWNSGGVALAEVAEILPPVAQFSTMETP